MRKTAVILVSLLFPALLSPLAAPPSFADEAPAGVAWRVGGLLARSDIWTQYRDRFVKGDGRVVDTANGDASHSEGQGYGLLLAVAGGDRATFDRILDWTSEHLITRGDGLVAWNDSDANDAADGDILVAWALAEAVDYWRDPKYLTLAKSIAENVAGRLLDRDARRGLLLKPGAVGFSSAERPDGPVVNPSYWVLPAFERLRELAPDADWDALKTTGLGLMASARSESGLASDWLSLGGDAPAPAAGFPEGFGYNAVRLPLYVFWSGAEAPDLMRNVSTAWRDGAFSATTPTTGRQQASFVEPGYAKVFALAQCAAAGDAYPQDFYAYSARQNYYPASLGALATIAAATRGGACLDATAMAEELGGAALEPAADVSRLTLTAVAEAQPVTEPRSVASNLPKPPKVEPAFAVHPELASESLLGTIGTVGFLAVLGAIGFALHRRRERQRRQRLTTMFSPAAAAGEDGKKAVPRTLPINPYDDSTSPETLPRQMENAAEASKEFGRTLGVIYFDLGEPPRGKRKRATPGRESELNALLERLRKELRGTDYATILDEHEIVACVGLLPGMTELKTISERLRKAGRTFENFADVFETPAGMSIYPLDGYRGEELINRARSRYKTQRAAPAPAVAPTPTPPKASATTRGSRKQPASVRH